MTRTQSLVWASAHFLATPFPYDIFEYGDEDDILKHIAEHPWQPFEGYPASDVYDYIETRAKDVRTTIQQKE